MATLSSVSAAGMAQVLRHVCAQTPFILNGVQICFIVGRMATTPSSTRAQAAPPSNAARDLALISVFAAFIAVCAILPSFPMGSGVPITFQTLAIYITALVLGGTRAALATLLYVVVGLLGLPIFAGFKGGIGVLAGPSAGYLLGFVPGAFLIGFLAYRFSGRRRSPAALAAGFVGAVLLGFALITVFGIAGMMVNLSLPLDKAVMAALPFVPGDLIKCALATLVAVSVHKAFPQLMKA